MLIGLLKSADIYSNFCVFLSTFFLKIIEIGEDKGRWSTNAAPLDDVYAVVTDDIQFLFKDNTTVYMADDRVSHIYNFVSIWFYQYNLFIMKKRDLNSSIKTSFSRF